MAIEKEGFRSETLSTEPPKPTPGDKFKKDGKEYVVCGKGTCTLNTAPDVADWCDSDDCDKEDCECWVMIARKKDKDPKWEPWRKNSKDPKQYDNYLWYCCCCLKPIPGS